MAINVRPLGDRVLVQAARRARNQKGRHHHPRYRQGKAAGRQSRRSRHRQADDDGKKVEFTVKKGDKVLITKYGGTEIKVDGESYLIMREDDILGIIG